MGLGMFRRHRQSVAVAQAAKPFSPPAPARAVPAEPTLDELERLTAPDPKPEQRKAKR